MPTRSVKILVAIGATLAIAAPAAAGHGSIHPTVRSERTYIHCNGPAKVENVNFVANGAPSWNTTAPVGSYTQGDGCGTLDPGGIRSDQLATPYDAPLSGTFNGNIRDLTLELHSLVLSRTRQTPTFPLRIRMLIDEVPVFSEPDGVTVNMTPTLSSTGISEKFLLSIPNLGCSREVLDADGNVIDVVTDGLVTEDGDGDDRHEIDIAIDSSSVEFNSAWVWDATEIPSGITFNTTGPLASARAEPEDPADCA